jgi:hypothetical protein
MIPYQTKTGKLSGTSDDEVYKQARAVYDHIKSKSKRRPYIRSAYFGRQKVFFDFFWKHLAEKRSRRVRTQRLKYFACAIELIRKSRNEPISKENPNKRSEILHRFVGLTRDRELFFVQIKEDRRTSRKYLMSVFAPN